MSFEKFRILLWKNWTIKKRHYKSGIFELIFPVLLIIVFTWVKKQYTAGTDDEPSRVASYEDPIVPSNSCIIFNSNAVKIAMSPVSPWLEEFVQSVFSGVEGEAESEVVSFINSKALDDFLVSNLQKEPVYGIEFEDSLSVTVLIVLLSTCYRINCLT